MAEQLKLPRSALARGWPWLLILLYWAVRLHNLEALPFFLDEANHLWWTRLVWALQPFHAASDGRILNIWWSALFWPFAGSVWIMRAASILLTTVGFAALVAFARAYYSDRAAVIAALLYCVTPYAVFYERMALADTLSPAFTMLLVWFSAMAAERPRQWKWAAAAGVALAADVLSKLSNLIFVPAPALAALFLFRRERWRRQAIATGLVYSSAVAILYPVVFVLRRLADSDLGLDLLSRKASPTLAEMVVQVDVAGRLVWSHFWTLFTPSLWLVGLAAVGIALLARRRASLYLGTILLFTVSALIARTAPGFLESRFGLVYVPLITLLIAAGFVVAWQRLARLGRTFSVVVVLAGLLVLGAPGAFLWAAWTQPAALTLVNWDYWQYVSGWPSGYGFREIARDYAIRGQPVQLITFDLGGWQRFQAYLPPDSPVTPVWVSPEEFAAGVRPNPGLGPALLILDRPKDDADLARTSLVLTEVAAYPRPGGVSWLGVYEFR